MTRPAPKSTGPNCFVASCSTWTRCTSTCAAGRSPIAEWRRWLDTLGQRVTVTHHGATDTGLAEDIDEHGNLLLRTDDGGLLTLTAGDITLRPMQGAPAANA